MGITSVGISGGDYPYPYAGWMTRAAMLKSTHVRTVNAETAAVRFAAQGNALDGPTKARAVGVWGGVRVFLTDVRK